MHNHNNQFLTTVYRKCLEDQFIKLYLQIYIKDNLADEYVKMFVIVLARKCINI